MTLAKQNLEHKNSATLQSEFHTLSALIGELQRLKNLLNAGQELVLRWVPQDGELHGEVKGTNMLIYDKDVGTALATLRHEFLDYVICQAIEPYKKVTNKLIELLNEEAYAKKEKLVELLSKTL